MTAPLNRDIIDQMRVMFLDGVSMANIGHTLNVHELTVAKYRDLENWVGLKKRLQEKIIRKQLDDAAKRKERHIQMSQILQKSGSDYLLDDTVKKKVRDGNTARAMIVDGVKLEREILGESEADEIRVRIEIIKPNGELTGGNDSTGKRENLQLPSPEQSQN